MRTRKDTGVYEEYTMALIFRFDRHITEATGKSRETLLARANAFFGDAARQCAEYIGNGSENTTSSGTNWFPAQ